ncbi:unnamed protein product [Rhizoctonia solani]|uniref:F-box domain-containing protein n=1 Tax=Rhizoctonia solani TaxID=456999 RepID=A0A8H2ZYC7_9AGAM|nr:unnamed protein product [Rhizoctonia solani]
MSVSLIRISSGITYMVIIGVQVPIQVATIQRWEELGDQLEKVTTAYDKACRSLEPPVYDHSHDVNELVPKIDGSLQRLDNLVLCLNSARSSLARTRNQLHAPILFLPDDITSIIFKFYTTINAVETEHPNQCTVRDLVTNQYRRLHVLIGVCSAWRNLVLSDGKFWSVVPIIPQRSSRYMSTAAQLSLQRSAGCSLHLVVELFMSRPDISTFFLRMLNCNGPRFRSINLKGDCGLVIMQAINLLSSTTNGQKSLDDLSICYHDPQVTDPIRLSPTSDWEQAVFNQMLGSLRILRLRGAIFDARGISFLSLTYLRIQHIRLESHAKIEELLWVLSSSSQIRMLELITVFTCSEVDVPPQRNRFPVPLPALRRLYLEDLFQDMLNFVLSSIEPGPHRVTLHLTSNCLWIYNPEEIVIVGMQGLRLREFNIDTLVLTTRFGEAIFDGARKLLELMLTVTTLLVDGYELSSSYLNQLIRITDPAYSFPNLTKLHISRSMISPINLDLLKAVVTSHSIHDLGLGLCVNFIEDGRISRHCLEKPHERLDAIRNWFLNATTVTWLAHSFSARPPAPEFESDIW